jgi:DNA-binding MarR family transcriptional regulator
MHEDDFTARLMSEMEPDLLDALQHRINSFIKWDLIKFLHENPHTFDTADQIARYIGREPTAVRAALEELHQSGLVERTPRESQAVFALQHTPAAMDLVKRFLKACEDRHFRVKAVYHIVRASRG